WEVMLLPMYFLIGVWGGPRREYAAIKFFLYTLLGSVFILIAILGFYFTNLRDFVPQSVVEAEVKKLQKDQPYLSDQQAREQVKVNTFDMVVLARAGKGALQYLGSGGDAAAVTSAPPVEAARREVAALERKGAAEGEVRAARERLAAAQAGLRS